MVNTANTRNCGRTNRYPLSDFFSVEFLILTFHPPICNLFCYPASLPAICTTKYYLFDIFLLYSKRNFLSRKTRKIKFLFLYLFCEINPKKQESISSMLTITLSRLSVILLYAIFPAVPLTFNGETAVSP